MVEQTTQSTAPPPTQQIQGYTLQQTPTGGWELVNPGYRSGSPELLNYVQSAYQAGTRGLYDMAYGAGMISGSYTPSQAASQLASIGINPVSSTLGMAAEQVLKAYSNLGSSAQASGGGTGSYTSQTQQPMGLYNQAGQNVGMGSSAYYGSSSVEAQNLQRAISAAPINQYGGYSNANYGPTPQAASNGLLTAYVPVGNYRQMEVQNAKVAVNPISGEYGLYQQLPAGRMVQNPDTGKLENYILVGGGSVGAATSGTVSLAALTPAVISQESGTYIKPKFAAYDTSVGVGEILASIERGAAGDELSRLGAEAYGGVVSKLDNRVLGGITYENYKYPAAQGNLSDLTYRPGVNVAQAYLSDIPWSVGSEATNLMALGPSGVSNIANISQGAGGPGGDLGIGSFYGGKPTKPLAFVESNTQIAEAQTQPALPSVEAPAIASTSAGATSERSWLDAAAQTAYRSIAVPAMAFGATVSNVIAPGGTFKLPSLYGPGVEISTNAPTNISNVAQVLTPEKISEANLAGVPGFTTAAKGFQIAGVGLKELGIIGAGTAALAVGGKVATGQYEIPQFNLPTAGGIGPVITDVPATPQYSTPGQGIEGTVGTPGKGSDIVVNAPGEGFGNIVGVSAAGVAIGQGIAGGFFPSVIELPKSSITSEDITGFVAPVLPTAMGGAQAIIQETGRPLYDLSAATKTTTTELSKSISQSYSNLVESTEAGTTAAVGTALLGGVAAANAVSNAFATPNALSTPVATPTFAPVTEAVTAPATLSSTMNQYSNASQTNYQQSFGNITGPSSKPDFKLDLKGGFMLPSFGSAVEQGGKKRRFGRFKETLVGVKYNLKGGNISFAGFTGPKTKKGKAKKSKGLNLSKTNFK